LLEGTTYESNVTLLDSSYDNIPIASIDENSESIIVFFYLETGSLNGNADILQVAAKHEDYVFSIYIKPTQKIKEDASAVHGLRYVDGNLQLQRKTVIAVSLSHAMLSLYQFLYSLRKKCILTAHNCVFDYPR